MTAIAYNQLSDHLAEAKQPALVYLIHGEEFFYKTAFEKVVHSIIPEKLRKFNIDELDGNENNFFEAVERVNTFSLDASAKVVVLRDSNIFYAKQDKNELIQKIKESVADDNLKKGANIFLKLLGLMDIELDEISKDDERSIAEIDSGSTDNKWLDEIIKFCRDNYLSQTAAPNSTETLQKAIEKGFATGNHLIITTDLIDKRLKLYKVIEKHGLIIDCSVAKGNTQADKKSQAAAFTTTMRSFLSEKGKKIDNPAAQAMQEMIGFDLRTLANSLEKLTTYIGERPAITTADVKAVLQRTKIDPLYELTNAVADRNTTQALFYLKTLMSGAEPIHPLPILAAITNQNRRLLLIKSFVKSSSGQEWSPGMPYNVFQQSLSLKIKKYDANIIEQVEERDKILNQEPPATSEKVKKKKAKKKGKPTEMLIAARAGSLYPIYMNYKKAANFSEKELWQAFVKLKEADLQLKGSGLEPRLILEYLVINICQKQAATLK